MISRSAERDGYSLSRHGEEHDGQGGSRKKRATFAARRKMAKMMRSQHSPNALRRTRVHSPGESDSDEEEQQGEADEEDHAQSDDSEEDDGEPGIFAPSGAAVLHIAANSRGKKLRSSAHQAGPHGSKRQKLSPTVKTRSSPRNRGKASPELLAPSSPTPTPAELNLSLLDDDASSSDDDVYDLVDMMSDDDEDDIEVEAVEEQMLLEEMAANGELGAIMFGDGDSMFPGDDGTSSFGRASLYSDRYGIPEEGFDMSALTSRGTSVAGDFTPKIGTMGSTAATPFESDADVDGGATTANPSALTSPLVAEFSMEPLSTGILGIGETGLCTPSSLKQPMDWANCDPDETDPDEPKPESISVNIAALRKKQKPVTVSSVTPAGIRKNKKFKTPKAGSFSISRKDICMSHDRAGKLVVSGNKKARRSGYNTPKGIVPVDPFKLTPSGDGTFSNTIRTLQFAGLGAGAAMSPVEQATAMLFQTTTSLSGPLFSEEQGDATQSSLDGADPKSNGLLVGAPSADEDLHRYVDFLGKEGN